MCPQCQSPVRSDVDFCPNCGAALRGQAPAGQAPTGQAPTDVRPPGTGPGGAGPGQPAGGWTPPGQVQRPAGAAPAFRLDVSRLNVADRVIAGTSIIVFISLFLPWFGVPGFAVSGMSWHGYLVISLLAAVALIGYLILRAGLASPFRLPIAHAPLLLIGTAVQLFFVLIAFAFKPAGTSWEFGAYLGLLAALIGCGVIAVPAIRSLQSGQRS
jgi:zinc-ribbon domain